MPERLPRDHDAVPSGPSPPRVIFRPDALRAGWVDHEIARARSRGEWESIRPGAYVDRGASGDISARERHLALIAATIRLVPDDAVISHATAAVLHGITVWPPPVAGVHVTRPGSGGGHRRRLLHTRMAQVTDGEVVTIGQFRVTTVERTLVDFGRSSSFCSAVVALDDALHAGLTTKEALVPSLESASRRPGVASARRAVLFSDPGAESVGESRSRVIMHTAGLPAPVSQLEVRDELGRFVGRGDFGWAEARTIGEFDGMIKYGRLLRPGEDAGSAVQREKVREDAIRDLGWFVVRWTWADLNRPADLVSRISRALHRGRTAVAGWAPMSDRRRPA